MDIREFEYGDKVELPDDFQEPCDPFLQNQGAVKKTFGDEINEFSPYQYICQV